MNRVRYHAGGNVTTHRPLVAHVTTTDISLELLLGPQLEAFTAAGFDVVGVSAPGPYVEALEQRGIRHFPLRHATRSFAPTEDLQAVGELVSVFRRLRPTIVHTHNPKPGLYGRVAARIARVPIVVNTVHGLYAQPHDPLARRAAVYSVERFAGLFSDAELLQNPEDIETLAGLGVSRKKLTLLGNGIDLTRFDPAAVASADVLAARTELGACGPDDVVVGLVGRWCGRRATAKCSRRPASFAITFRDCASRSSVPTTIKRTTPSTSPTGPAPPRRA